MESVTLQRSLKGPKDPALKLTKVVVRGAMVGTVGTAIAMLISIRKLPALASCREASRREVDKAYNAITFAIPGVFYAPKIYPTGTCSRAQLMLPLQDTRSQQELALYIRCKTHPTHQ